MSTFEDIFGQEDSQIPHKGTPEVVENYSGDNTDATPHKGTPEVVENYSGGISNETVVKPVDRKEERKIGTYEELYRQLNPYTPPTAEELEKERKKQKRNEIFAAIGDGVMALSNLFFTTRGAPNMYSGKNTMSEATKVRYDKLIKDREDKQIAYYNGLLRAKEADAAAANAEREWQRQLGLDREAQERYDEEQKYKREREDEEQKYKRERDKISDEQWQQTFDESKRRANQAQERHRENARLKHEANQAKAARGVRGKQIAFSDGDGNEVVIYENVWKGSMQQVYNILLEDLAPSDVTERRRWERQMKKLDTPKKKEDYVKQNWHKSKQASQIMLTLSGLDPATMTSKLSDEESDDYSQYEQTEEDYSQYEVK